MPDLAAAVDSRSKRLEEFVMDLFSLGFATGQPLVLTLPGVAVGLLVVVHLLSPRVQSGWASV